MERTIRITATHDMMEKRGIRIGDMYKVLSSGLSEHKKGLKYYYIEPIGGPIVVYENECIFVNE